MHQIWFTIDTSHTKYPLACLPEFANKYSALPITFYHNKKNIATCEQRAIHIPDELALRAIRVNRANAQFVSLRGPNVKKILALAPFPELYAELSVENALTIIARAPLMFARLPCILQQNQRVRAYMRSGNSAYFNSLMGLGDSGPQTPSCYAE